MFLKNEVKAFKHEAKAISRSLLKLVVFGALFVCVAMIILYAGSSPLWMKNFRIFTGGAFGVFLCYLSSVIFFFLCGGIIFIILQCRRSHTRKAGRVVCDIVAAYVFRVLWIILFFGGFSPLFAVVSLIAGSVFLALALIDSRHISAVVSAVLCVMLVFSFVFIVYTLKFLMIT